jgi:hypothetical protein
MRAWVPSRLPRRREVLATLESKPGSSADGPTSCSPGAFCTTVKLPFLAKEPRGEQALANVPRPSLGSRRRASRSSATCSGGGAGPGREEG